MVTKKRSKPAAAGKGKAPVRKTAAKKVTVKKTTAKKAAPKKITTKKIVAKKAQVMDPQPSVCTRNHAILLLACSSTRLHQVKTCPVTRIYLTPLNLD